MLIDPIELTRVKFLTEEITKEGILIQNETLPLIADCQAGQWLTTSMQGLLRRMEWQFGTEISRNPQL